MSHSGVSPSSTSTRATSVLLALVLLVAGAAVGTAVGVGPASADTATPTQWDSRIAPYAKIAEKLRGLTFDAPVPVRFLSPAKFEKTVTTDDTSLTAADRRDLRRYTGLLRALGLVTGQVDLFGATNEANGAGTLAYYSFEDKRITIRGQRLTPAVRSTLVHELTHALQDQHFSIGDRMAALDERADDISAEQAVLDAVVEGDAQHVESLYRDSLTARQRRALDRDQQRESGTANQRLQRVPTVIVTLMTAPYTLGQSLVETFAASGGTAAQDKLIQTPPKHETALLDPFRALAGRTGAIKVPATGLRKGETRFDSGELGVLTWYLMLAERLPLRSALAAADGWGGDSYVAFAKHGRSCARMTYVGRTPAATTRMRGALHRWVAKAPRTPASVRRDGRLVRFMSCDPGTSSRIGKEASERAVDLAATRTYLALSLLQAGAPATTARCIAGRLVHAFPTPALLDPSFGAHNRAVQVRIRRLVARCL
ncbi:MAG: hypothetical protein ABIQ59_11995 [Nocardioidaceae bacterium]